MIILVYCCQQKTGKESELQCNTSEAGETYPYGILVIIVKNSSGFQLGKLV